MSKLREGSVEAAGEGSFGDADCFAFCFAAVELSLVVGAGLCVVADPVEGGHVESPVELAVAAAVESVTLARSAGGLDGADTGERGKGGFTAYAARVGSGDEDLAGADWADARLFEQLRAERAGELGELAVDRGEFLLEQHDPFREPAQWCQSASL